MCVLLTLQSFTQCDIIRFAYTLLPQIPAAPPKNIASIATNDGNILITVYEICPYNPTIQKLPGSLQAPSMVILLSGFLKLGSTTLGVWQCSHLVWEYKEKARTYL